MLRCWQLLAAVAAEAKGVPAGSYAARKAALIRGARRYLEQGHSSYMQAIIQQNRSEVMLPSSPPPVPPMAAHHALRIRMVGEDNP